MSTDTKIKKFIINRMTKSQFDSLPTKNENELYFVEDDDTFLTKTEAEKKIPTQLFQLTGDETHRVVTDAEKAEWSAKSDFSGSYTDLTSKPKVNTVEVTGEMTSSDLKLLGLNGGTMAGNIDMANNQINGIPDATLNNQPASYGQLTALKNEIGNAFRFRGSVKNYSALPSSALLGDVYVTEEAETVGNIFYPANTSYVWSGSFFNGKWISLSAVLDTELSETSTNAVENKTITKALKDKLNDAPSDTNQYVRQDGAWVKVTIPEAKDEVVIGDTPPAEIPDLFIDTSRDYPIDPKPGPKTKPFWVIFDESKSTTVLETGGDANARDEFFKKFRRCLVKPQAKGAAITYLDENDSNNYEDGTPTNFGSGSLGLQMMVHFPKYYYKNEDLGGNRFKLWCCAEKPDDTYKEERAALVGVFEAFSDSGKLNSWSGRLSTGSKTITTFYNEAQANGKQWGLIDYRVHKSLANLFCLKYGNTNISTKNASIPCSGGTKSYKSGNTGSTLSLGNKDGLVNTSSSFLGVEDCYYSKWEAVQGVNIINRKWVVYDGGLKVDVDKPALESAGFKNVRVAGNGGTSDGYISKINHGGYSDIIPTSVSGSETTYYSDYYYQDSGNIVLFRSGYSGVGAWCGVFVANASYDSSLSDSIIGSRLCFYGDIQIKTKDEFIALTPNFKG